MNALDVLDTLDTRVHHMVFGRMQAPDRQVEDGTRVVVTHTGRSRAICWALALAVALGGVIGATHQPVLLASLLPVLGGSGLVLHRVHRLLTLTTDGIVVAARRGRPRKWAWHDVESVETIGRVGEPDVRVWLRDRPSPIWVSGPGMRAAGGSAAEFVVHAAERAGIPVLAR